MNRETCFLFVVSSAVLALAEIMGWAAVEQYMTSLWTLEPYPIAAIPLFLALGVLMPGLMFVVLWKTQRNLVRFLLLATAAATSFVSIAVVIRWTTTLRFGDPVTDGMLIALILPVICVGSLLAWNHLNRRLGFVRVWR